MSQDSLYQHLILKHSKQPQNSGSLPTPTLEAEESNPVCGDRVTIQIVLSQDIISDIRFQGEGCALSKASASLMTGRLKGLRLSEAASLMTGFRAMIAGEREADHSQNLAELEALGVVLQYPVRQKCVLLPWDAFRATLAKYESAARK